MNILLTIQQLFSGELIPALCRTLAHSLWQGLLMAVVAVIILSTTKRSGPALRYNLLTILYLVFTAGVVITLCIQLNNLAGVQHSAGSMTLVQSQKDIATTVFIHPTEPVSITAIIISFIDKHANTIALAWFIILLFKAARLCAGLHGIYRIRRVQVTDAGEHWNERIRVLADRLRIRRHVSLLQSGIARVPAVLGYFKPLILFPAGLLASMPPEEVEAVLLHELAHVRRKDYLVNLLQQLVEVFLFFNPAVSWVSSLIRSEREHCCDDIALEQTSNNKINYIHALISFREYQLALQYAPAFLGRKDDLQERVRRIIYNNNKTLNAMEKIFLTSGLAIAGIIALAFSSGQCSTTSSNSIVSSSATKSIPAQTKSTATPISDTVPFKKHATIGQGNINKVMNGKRYDLRFNDDVVTELRVDGQKVDDNKLADYKTITDAIIKQAMENSTREKLLAEKAMLKAEQARTDAEMSKLLAEKAEKNSELSKLNDENSLQLMEKLKEVNLQQSKIKEEQSLQLLSQLKEMKAQEGMLQDTEVLMEKLKTPQSMTDAVLSKQLAEKLQLLTLADTKQQLRLAQTKKELAAKDAVRLRVDAEMAMKLSEELRDKVKLSMKKDLRLQATAKTTSEEIITDLSREKLIKDKNDLSFSLNKNELIVNGVKQPEAIFRKFKEKYVKREDWNFNYNNKE